ncbi:glycosyltransferase family 4 protein [uncultured Nonlabens sp.]|uniref:glycosyltransferase family 4 protein n=1 Tax=uncultured Nonlabens sp. TaxID=859306 RepID=UPI002627A330|nr:glycosyltransferase family 4 protein [uncultured Nonlabens sp.]
MNNILYIGNKLAGHGATATTIDTLGPLLEKEGYNVRYASSIKNISKRMLHMMRMTYLNRKWADVVLIDTYSTKNFWYAITISRICKSLNLKYIPILHGGNLPSRLEKNPKAIKFFLDNAYQVVSPSEFLKLAFNKVGFQNIIKINNFIELENYPFTDRIIKEPKLLWVRSFAQIYNPQMAVFVLKELKEKYPAASLTMVGPDKDGTLATCRTIAKNMNLDVTFTGLLSKKQWVELSKSHNIFINTTHFDNLPVSLIEAMALGLPIISTNVGGISCLIDNDINGKLIPDNDVHAMVESVNELIDKSLECNNIILTARKYTQQFSWSEVSKDWNTLLKV